MPEHWTKIRQEIIGQLEDFKVEIAMGIPEEAAVEWIDQILALARKPIRIGPPAGGSYDG